MNLSKTQQAIIALIIANIIWGAASPIFKWALVGIEPFTLGFLRFAIASILLVPFTIGKFTIKRADYTRLTILSLVGITFGISFFFFGLRLTESINVPIIASAGPIFIIFFSWLILKEIPKTKVILGTLISLAGVLVIVLQPILGAGFDGSLAGNFLIVLAVMAGVVHTILSKEMMKTYDPATITFWSFFIATLGFAPLSLYEISTSSSLTAITYQGFIGVIFGAILSSFLAYYLFYWALKYFPASETGLFVYLDPIVAILIAMPLLGEYPTSLYWLGAILVFGGIYIAEGRLPYHPLHKFKENQ